MNKTEFKIGDKVMVEGTVVEFGDWFGTDYARIKAQAGEICIPMQYLAPAQQEKVKIPQFVADWIVTVKKKGGSMRAALTNGSEKVEVWLCDFENQDVFARAWLDGYEVEQEKFYRVPLKGFVSSNGQQYLTKESSQSSNFFACALNRSLVQEFTMDEIPEEYRQWAEEVEE